LFTYAYCLEYVPNYIWAMSVNVYESISIYVQPPPPSKHREYIESIVTY